MLVFVVVHCLHDNEQVIGVADSLDAALLTCQRYITSKRIPVILIEPEAVAADEWLVKIQNKDNRHFEIIRLPLESLNSLLHYAPESSSSSADFSEMGD